LVDKIFAFLCSPGHSLVLSFLWTIFWFCIYHLSGVRFFFLVVLFFTFVYLL